MNLDICITVKRNNEGTFDARLQSGDDACGQATECVKRSTPMEAIAGLVDIFRMTSSDVQKHHLGFVQGTEN